MAQRAPKEMKRIFSILAALVLTGCSLIPLAPGHASFRSENGSTYEVQQSQNPKTATTQKYERTKDGTEKFETTIGAAQKDTAREMAAKLSSLKGVVWIGILVFLFGVASFVWPPLKVIVGGSVTTSAVIAAAGLALIILPSLLVGHEILILAVCAGVAGIYWFAHRHGTLKGVIDTLKEK
jgi:hypothetical protein